MTDREKIEVLEKENKLLKEQIELLKELKTKTKTEYVPYYPWWWYNNIPEIKSTPTSPTITWCSNTDDITTVTAPSFPTDTNYIYATGHTEFINNFNTTKTGDAE